MHVNTRNDLQEQCRTWATEQEECKDHIAALKAKLFAVTNAEVRQKGKKAKLLPVLFTGTCSSYLLVVCADISRVLLAARPNEKHPSDIVAVFGPGQ